MKRALLLLLSFMLIIACETPDNPTPVDPVIPDPVTTNPDWVIGTYVSDIYNLQTETPKLIQFTESECFADLTLDGFMYANAYYFLHDATGTEWQPITNVTMTDNVVQWTQYDIWNDIDLTFKFEKIDAQGEHIDVWVSTSAESHSFGTFTKVE